MLQSRLPVKIDLGAVYNLKPRDSKKTKIFDFQAEERELVFDIDMTDYDDIRICCQGTGICPKCWPFMIVAAHILEAFLREDFGFTNILWVYSGRRGIHCWVADERARVLRQTARDSVANFINIFDGGQFKAKKVEVDGNRGMHPSIIRSVRIIDKYFEQLMIVNQDFLGTKERIDMAINLCQDELLKRELREVLHDPKLKSSADRYIALEKISRKFYSHTNRQVSKYVLNKHKYFLEEVKLQLCYPRLDINVTKGLNHLLKVPFSVHPKTGRVCVPIDFATIDTFDPFTVPTLNVLCDEVVTVTREMKSNGQEEQIKTFGSTRIAERTSIAPALTVFRAFIRGIEGKLRPVLLEKSDNKLAF